MKHLLVTNDFPPKIGGIQSYLWELWRRLPAEEVTVLTTPYEGDAAFDADQAFRVVRTSQWWLLPTLKLTRQINRLADEVGAELIVLDPGLPLGLVGPNLRKPYVVIGHGAEIVIPAKLPLSSPLLHRVLKHSVGLVSAGEYVKQTASRWSSVRDKLQVNVPPGVDVTRFVPLNADEKAAARQRLGLPAGKHLVVGVSRLVPRKGFDRLIRAVASLQSPFPDIHLAIAGKGREFDRLSALALELGAPVTMLGRVPDEDLPALVGCADVFSMPCHDRWFGLEREGFGIVFVEAASAGVPSVAGLSGGSAEAVLDGHSGVVVGGKVRVADIAAGIALLLADDQKRAQFGAAARARMESDFAYEHLADRLRHSLVEAVRQARSNTGN